MTNARKPATKTATTKKAPAKKAPAKKKEKVATSAGPGVGAQKTSAMVSLGTIIAKAFPVVLSVEQIQGSLAKAGHPHMKETTVTANRAGMMRMLKITKGGGPLEVDGRETDPKALDPVRVQGLFLCLYSFRAGPRRGDRPGVPSVTRPREQEDRLSEEQ